MDNYSATYNDKYVYVPEGEELDKVEKVYRYCDMQNKRDTPFFYFLPFRPTPQSCSVLLHFYEFTGEFKLRQFFDLVFGLKGFDFILLPS